MDISTPVCPVPFEQQPLNEYQDLKESWFFRWATLPLQTYLTTILWIWMCSWVVVGPVATYSFSWAKHPVQFALSGAAGASLMVALALLRLYLGWSYIRDRLLNETVFYEESGWYDGQYWPKPPEVLTRDRLIVSYEIQPILRRLQRSFGCLIGLFCCGGIVWQYL